MKICRHERYSVILISKPFHKLVITLNAPDILMKNQKRQQIIE